MCGIVGCYGKGADCTGMLELMLHRGPDATYVWRDGAMTFGMNRLSINDTEHGRQPFLNADSTIAVIFNGEIYNHLELQKLCDREFLGHCDGLVLPFLYEKYGVDCFAWLNGMFAIAIYDKKQKKIILVRDGIGEKPLYYSTAEGGLVFCSLLEPLRWHFKKMNHKISLDYSALWDFLTFGFIPEPKTCFGEIKALQKGCYLEFDYKGAKVCEKYFYSQTLKHFATNMQCGSREELIENSREIVSKSIEHRLLSDVPVGCFLSGGLDSSIVVGVASSQIKHLRTFNIAFIEGKDPYCGFSNESEFAKLVSKHFKTEHSEIQVTAQSFQESLREFISHIDQPFGAISGIGIYLIAKMAHEKFGIKVLLSGDGADEMFGGYSWYPKLRFNVPKFITKEKPKGWHYYAFESEKRNIFNGEFFKNLNSTIYFPKGDSEPLEFIEFDRNFYLPFEMMVKLDRMCMGASVEGRACYVAPEIVAFCKSLDYEILLKEGGKWLLKEAFRDILPKSILEREKHGFNVPIDDWIKKDWLELLENALGKKSILHKLGLLRANCREYFMDLLGKYDRRVGNIAFYLIVLNLWLEKENL